MFSFVNKLISGRRSVSTRSRTRRPSVSKVAQPRQLELEGLEERMVLSPVWDKYWSLGGPNGFLGQPTTPEYIAPDGIGHYEHFQGGSIYWSPWTAAHEVHGSIRGEWANLGWERSFLGYPTSDETTTGKGDGRYNWFQGGLIEWSPSTGAHEVHGAILQEFAGLGYERSVLGYPVSDETTTGRGDGRYNGFQAGLILWSPATGAHEVHGAILGEYAGLGYERSFLGYPTSDESTTGKGDGRYNWFQGGLIMWSPNTGAHELHGAILGEYAGLGYERSVLGYPTSDETDTYRHDGRYNNFQYGNIYWSPATGAHEVHGAIWGEYSHLSWELGFLGFPTSDETGTAQNGRYNSFQGGFILWSAATGAHEVHGAILSEYAAIGWQNSALGFPTSDETDTARHDGRFNNFQYGNIYWSPATGAHEVHGAIWGEYTHLSWELSFLGFPTSDETSTAQNGRYNSFQGGFIFWSAATGAHEVHGAILDAYANLGWQNSLLGFPVTDETGTPDGYGRFNHFQGGTIYWTPWGGAYPILLQDRALAAVEQSYARNGVLGRNGMLAAFGYVENQGSVSTADFADLQALEAIPAIGLPDYVRDLSNKVVNGNVANAQYQGQGLGNLFAGSSAQQLTNLVNKWFVGADRPAASGTYQLASGTLFGNGIAATFDVDQGAAADCYFVAALGEVAQRTPDAISQMFIDNGDGTWTVRFFNNGAADYVTVDKYFPAYGGGNFVYDNHDHQLSDGSNKLWVALAEKAYAQLAEEGWSRGAGAANSYNSINFGDPGSTLREITGLATSDYNLTSANSDRDFVSDAFNSGKLLVLGTPVSGVASNVVANHAYFLVYANSDSDLFILVNPWGVGASQPGILYLTWSQVAASFNYWSQTN